MDEFIKSASLLFVLLNPFLLVIYLVEPMERLDRWVFNRVLLRAGLIACAVFCGFALLGEKVFSRYLHAEFASFQIFGGLIFLLIGIQFVMKGTSALDMLRGEPEKLAGAIAMPVLVGPGTISASVVIGQSHEGAVACAAIVSAVFSSVVVVGVLKWLHDCVRPRHERLIERYIDITGRIMALYVGTVAVEMIMVGLRTWSAKF